MQLYNGKVRLGGNVANEVRKTDMTAAEIEILRAMHGADAVVDIEATRMDRRTHVDERRRLLDAYVSPEHNNAERLAAKQQLFRNLFGHDSTPLPVKLAGDIPVAAIADKPKRTKVDKSEETELVDAME